MDKETCSSSAAIFKITTLNTPKDSVYFSYSTVMDSGLTGSVAKTGLRVGTSGYTISENLINLTNNKLAAVYTLVPQMYGCPGSPIILTDSVQPVPAVTSSALRQAICDQASTSFKLTTVTIPSGSVNFNFTASATGSIIGFTSNISGLSNGDSISDVLYNLGNKPDSVTYKITPS